MFAYRHSATHPILAIRKIRQIADEAGLTVRILPQQLTECQQDCLRLLQETGEQMTTTRILEELEKRNWLWGERTVKAALADLVRLGLIRSSRRTPRGYRVIDQ